MLRKSDAAKLRVTKYSHLPLGGRTTPKAPKARIVRERPGKEERHEFGQRDRTGHIFAKGRRIHACHPV